MLAKVLMNVGFVFALIGVMGFGGAVETGEGWIASIVLFAVGVVLCVIGWHEDGGVRSDIYR